MNRKLCTPLVLIYLICFLIGLNANAQIDEICGAKQLSNSELEHFIQDLKEMKSPLHLRSNELLQVPIRFTVLRNDDGSETIGNTKVVEVDQKLIDSALDSINVVFSSAGLKFIQLGEIQYIDHTDLRRLKVPYRNFSYVSSALNVVIGGIGTGGVTGSANMPNALPPSRNYSNTLWVKNGNLLTTSTLIHELGHSFGLFHTFEGARYYDNPHQPMQDVPEGTKRFTDNPDPNAPNYFKRELVIRKDMPASEKLFPLYNADIAGDFVEDTPASCATSPKANFPDWQNPDCQSWKTMGDCYNGCVYDPDVCVYVGTYVDYNNDTLQQTDIMVRNFMSYTGNCRKEFTPGQFERMRFYAEKYRKKQYDPTGSRFLDGHVEFMDTEARLSNVNIRFKHPGDGRHCNITTDSNGDYQAIVYEDDIEVNYIHKLGQHNTETYTVEEWKSGLDYHDVQKIINHLNNVEKLNSFQQLAADVNMDCEITIDDVYLIKKLLRGEIDKFPDYYSPWVFYPKHEIFKGNDRGANFAFCGENVENAVENVTSEEVSRKILNFSDNNLIFVAVKLGDIDKSIAKKLPIPTQAKTKAHPKRHSAPDNFVELTKPHSMDIVNNSNASNENLHCFPNPTYSGLNIAFNSGEEASGKISIIEASGKVFSIIEKIFTKGSNYITIAGNQLPKGVVQINVTTDKESITKKIVKIE